MSLNKKQLIAEVASEQGLTQKNAEELVDSVLSTIKAELSNGGSVDIFGFGSFKAVRKTARTGRNPATGTPVEIPAKTVVKFTPAKALKEALN